MKTKSLLFGLLASAAMVSCTNEVDSIENNGAIQAGEKSYVAVNIVAPVTRAFLPGSDAEVAVEDAVFLFLDKNFNGCALPYVCSEGLDFGDANGTGLDKEATVLVIDGAKEVPSYIVAVLNPVNANAYTASTSLADLKAENANYTTYTNEGEFVMSNAVYKAENGKEVAATPITMENIFSTDDAAMENPVTIQVERVVAKVEVALGTAAAEWQDSEDLDDGDKDLELVIDGWDILQNNNSTLVKNVNLSWTHTWWNDVDLKRSYWAVDYRAANRNVLLFDNMTIADSRYVEETVNQTANDEGENVGNNINPYLVVAAHFEDAETGEPISLVEWRGRKYSLDGYLNFIAGNSKLSQYWYKTGENAYSQFSAALLAMVDDATTDWKASAQLTSAAAAYEYYTCNYDAAGQPVEGSWELVKADAAGKSPVANAVAEFGDVQYWNGGKTYYYTPITHRTVNSDKYYGVVRNHWYKVDINSISGYGTPVSNPGQAIEIPEKPVDDNSYLAADVVILEWAIVNNEVDLQ